MARTEDKHTTDNAAAPRGKHAAPVTDAAQAHAPEEPDSPRRKKRRKIVALVIVLILLVGAAAAGAIHLWLQQQDVERAAQLAAGQIAPATTVAATTVNVLPDNPIDFATLQSENPDIYAWIYIPDTGINNPVLQSPSDDNYYIDRDRDGNSSAAGSIFSQSLNAMDFSDPVTVLYGHDVDGMFKNLHDFEDATFFDEHPTFYVYRQGHVLTYTIVSAYKYDNRHILNSFDFSNVQTRLDYFAFVENPDSLLVNRRDGVTLDENSKLLQLSTCMLDEYHGNSRYLVSAVLTNGEETK